MGLSQSALAISDATVRHSITVFILGGTGYIGGTVLAHLLDSHVTGTMHLIALTRSEEKANKLRALGVEAIVGSLDEVDKLEQAASRSDVVIECANADHMLSNNAILAGLRRRRQTTDRMPILIHTSGTGVLADHAGGMYGTEFIYYDSDPNQMAAIPSTQPHRDVDLNVVAADKEGYVKTYIVLPSTAYGIARNVLVDAGIMNPQSQQIPALIRASIDRGQTGMVGEGKNFHPNVHVDDVAELYRTILEAAIADDPIGHGPEGYYFGENGEHTMLQVAEAMGNALKRLRLVDSATPSTFTEDELAKYFGGSDNLGTNVRCRGERARAIGWKPKRTTKDMLTSIKPEIEYMLSRRK